MFVRVVAGLTLFCAVSAPATAVADEGVCHVVDVQLQPQKRTDLRPGKQLPPQIVIWVEDAAGNFVDTVFITQQTGTYGLGNRPGRMDFNSAPLWPYGKRITTFPVWAEKKLEFGPSPAAAARNFLIQVSDCITPGANAPGVFR